MEENQDPLKDLSEIRSILENNTKFMSLSGLSGIFAGLVALGGAAAGYYFMQSNGLWIEGHPDYRHLNQGQLFDWVTFSLLGIAGGVFLLAMAGSYLFSRKMAQKKALPFWNRSARQMLMAMVIPIAAGGAYCAIQLWHGQYEWLASNMLIFYGLALLNASKFTISDIRYLAFLEIALGIASAVWWGHGIWFWIVGFGLLHIGYGIWIYYKYER